MATNPQSEYEKTPVDMDDQSAGDDIPQSDLGSYHDDETIKSDPEMTKWTSREDYVKATQKTQEKPGSGLLTAALVISGLVVLFSFTTFARPGSGVGLGTIWFMVIPCIVLIYGFVSLSNDMKRKQAGERIPDRRVRDSLLLSISIAVVGIPVLLIGLFLLALSGGGGKIG